MRVFVSAKEFLNLAHRSKTGCLMLDVHLPGMNGFELHRELLAGSCRETLGFLTARGVHYRSFI